MDWEPVAGQLLRALRGRRSQRQLSRRLGFSSNILYRWESGRSWPPAHEFFRLSAMGRAPLLPRLKAAHFCSEEDRTTSLLDPVGVGRWLDTLRGDLPLSSLAQLVGCSRFVVSRWLSGQTTVRLPDLLRVVDATTRRGLDFVAVFVDPAQLPSVAAEWETFRASREAALHYPWSHAVLRVLELEQYARLPKHERGFVARTLGISPQEEEECLDLLRRAGQIRLERGRWVVVEQRTVDTLGGQAEGKDPRGFWLDVARASWERAAPGVYSYNICSLSEADFARLQALHRRFFAEMREIVEHSTPNQRVALVATQIIGFGGPDGKW